MDGGSNCYARAATSHARGGFSTPWHWHPDLARADDALSNAARLWIADNVELYEGEARLDYPRVVEVRASLPSDKSFASYEGALAHVTGPRLPDNTELYWNQGLLDVLFEYSIRSDSSEFSIHLRLERLGLRTVTALRFLPPGGVTRAYEFHGDPGLVRLDPRWNQAWDHPTRAGCCPLSSCTSPTSPAPSCRSATGSSSRRARTRARGSWPAWSTACSACTSTCRRGSSRRHLRRARASPSCGRWSSTRSS